MKKEIGYLITLFLSFLFLGVSSQTKSIEKLEITTILTSYSVVATGDTLYERELLIQMSDTLGFESITAELDFFGSSGWESVNIATLTKPLTFTPCNQILCIYRKSKQDWVIYLGNYSLYDKHRISVHVNTLFSNSINTDWVTEF